MLSVARFIRRTAPALAAACTLTLHALPAAAQSARDGLLVDADWLMRNLETPGLVVVHAVRNSEGLDGLRTVPGATAIALDRISYDRMEEGEPHVMLDLPRDPAEIVDVFEAAGISDESRIVVLYDGGAFPTATRLVWTLQVAGRSDGVSILDGGVEAWQAAGGTVEAPASPSRGTLTGELELERRVDARWVLENGTRDGIALVDARRTASYDGSRPEMPGRAGHIPGAGSLPQVELYDDDGMLRPESELRDLFAAAGWEEGDRVVAYCHIGYWASAIVFAARTLGIDARLYDGSMTEWAQDPDLPLVVDPNGGG